MIDFEEYNSERVKTFLKYLVHAAAKHKPERPVIRERHTSRLSEFTELERPVFIEGSAERIAILTEERKEELATKIKMYYTRNKFLPYELRLSKLKQKYTSMKKKKGVNKKKLENIKKQIKSCQNLLKTLKFEPLA